MFRKFLPFFVVVSIVTCTAEEQKTLHQKRMERHKETHEVKSKVMNFCGDKKIPRQTVNEDEQKFGDLRGCYGKGLKHDSTGFINKKSYESLKKAIESNNPETFENILIGEGIRKLKNPQGGLPFSLAANDGWINTIRPAPEFDSAEIAGEMVELYWSVFVRDTPFNGFERDPTVALAVKELNSMSDFRGPKLNGEVTPSTFLRGLTKGDLIGPYISQFHYQTIPTGIFQQNPEQLVPVAGRENDYLVTFDDWYEVINGGVTGKQTKFENEKQFIRTPRDLAEFVHRDYPGQVFFSALLYLQSYGTDALDINNPYLSSQNQAGFVSFGLPHVIELLAEAIEESLKAAWYQKWDVHRRLRPEEFGFYLQKQAVDKLPMNIHSDLTKSQVVKKIHEIYGSYLLPQAYPEGSPIHPSYPAGHAVVAGASATILKAFFNEEVLVKNPVQPDITNKRLVPYNGNLKVGDELNKLAFNEALGRDHAGVHYRSDSTEGITLGEKVAIDVLENNAFLNSEKFEGFNLTKFDGTKVKIGGKMNTNKSE
ncbi:MAG: vanadium-dependent haloperoxidase [Chlamydiota bacterium]